MGILITKPARCGTPAIALALALFLTPLGASADQDWAGGLDVPNVQAILLQATAEDFGTAVTTADLPEGLAWVTDLPSREIGEHGFDLRPYIEGIAYFGPILRHLSTLPAAEQTAITAQVFTETNGDNLSEAGIALLHDLRAPEALVAVILQEAEANGANRIQLRGYGAAVDRYRETGDIGADTTGYILDKAPQAGAMLPIWQRVLLGEDTKRRLADAQGRLVDAQGRLVDARNAAEAGRATLEALGEIRRQQDEILGSTKNYTNQPLD